MGSCESCYVCGDGCGAIGSECKCGGEYDEFSCVYVVCVAVYSESVCGDSSDKFVWYEVVYVSEDAGVVFAAGVGAYEYGIVDVLWDVVGKSEVCKVK